MMQRGWHAEWVGSDRGLEARVIPGAGIGLHILRFSGLRGRGAMAWLSLNGGHVDLVAQMLFGYGWLQAALAGAAFPALALFTHQLALRLRREVASLREVASWPGMGRERATRLLNALYLQAGLIVSRSHPDAMRDSWF